MSNQTRELYQCGSGPHKTTEKSWGWTKVEAEKRNKDMIQGDLIYTAFQVIMQTYLYNEDFEKNYFWVRI